MSSIACVFPGQGSQHPQMLKTDLVDQSFINEKTQIVSEILSSDVHSILEDESKLNLTLLLNRFWSYHQPFFQKHIKIYHYQIPKL